MEHLKTLVLERDLLRGFGADGAKKSSNPATPAPEGDNTTDIAVLQGAKLREALMARPAEQAARLGVRGEAHGVSPGTQLEEINGTSTALEVAERRLVKAKDEAETQEALVTGATRVSWPPWPPLLPLKLCFFLPVFLETHTGSAQRSDAR
jgi:hypothetical protein